MMAGGVANNFFRLTLEGTDYSQILIMISNQLEDIWTTVTTNLLVLGLGSGEVFKPPNLSFSWPASTNSQGYDKRAR